MNFILPEQSEHPSGWLDGVVNYPLSYQNMKKYSGKVEQDFPESSPLLPALIAANIAYDYGVSYGKTAEIESFLNEKFIAIYESNESFGKKFIKCNEKSRDLMIAFMSHWAEAWLKRNLPNQYSKRAKTHESNLFEFTRFD